MVKGIKGKKKELTRKSGLNDKPDLSFTSLMVMNKIKLELVSVKDFQN